VNTLGSYKCECADGYTLDYDGKSCNDIDECEENTNLCRGGNCTQIKRDLIDE
jgi:hypothetical protein